MSNKWVIMERGGGKWELHQNSMLIGQYFHEIDSKKRLTIPSKWRKSLGEKVVVTTGLDKSLFLFTYSEWEAIATKLSSISFGNSESRSFNRFFLSNAFEVDVDKQGRVVIPETLARYSNLSSTIVLAGMYNRIEIWDEKAWKVCLSQSENTADTMAEDLHKLGVL